MEKKIEWMILIMPWWKRQIFEENVDEYIFNDKYKDQARLRLYSLKIRWNCREMPTREFAEIAKKILKTY